MKKVTLLIIIGILPLLGFCQVSSGECVSCDNNTVSVENNSSALGSQNISTGINSFACGNLNEATGDYSVAMPYLSRAYGNRSFALGYNALANGTGSFAIGTSSHTGQNGTLSIAIGTRVSTNANWAMVLGMGSNDSLLTNRIESSFMVGFNSDSPTFFVGHSDGTGTTGKIGIGDITDPQAKLHIRADESEDAVIKLEATGVNQYAQIVFDDDDNTITASSGSNMSFHTNETGNFRFNNGDVEINENLGIGTDDPQAKVHVKEGDIFIEDIDHGIVMKSPNGSCWRGTVTDDGQLQFTQVDCDELMVSTPEPEPAQNTGIRIYPNPTGNRVTVEIPAERAGATLSIKSSGGKQLAATHLTGTSNSIDMSSYPAGVYFFYISVDGKLLEVKKVVKE